MATRKSKRKKKARVFSICLIIIALVLIVGCGLYILNEKKTDTVVSNITPTTTTTIDQSQPTENNSEEAENKQESKDDLFDLFLNGKKVASFCADVPQRLLGFKLKNVSLLMGRIKEIPSATTSANAPNIKNLATDFFE